MDKSAVVDKYVEELGSDEPFVRRVAARALGELRDTGSRAALAGLLVDPDASVRIEVVKAFGAMMDEENAGAVVAALQNDPDGNVRAAAATTLGTLRSQSSINALSDALKDPAWNVRGAAALALGQMGGEKGINALSRALNDVYGVFADFASDTLKKRSAQKDEGMTTEEPLAGTAEEPAAMSDEDSMDESEESSPT